MPSTQSDMQRRAVDVLGGVDRAYARVQTTLGESLRTSVLDQASSAVSEMYEVERQAREMLAEPTRVADLIGGVGSAAALAQSSLAETVQTGIQRAAKLADAIDADRYNTVESLSLNTANHYKAVEQLSLNTANHYKAVEQLSLNTANHYKAVEQLSLNTANHYKAVESLSLNTANHYKAVEQLSLNTANRYNTVEQLSLNTANRYNTVESLSLAATRALPGGSAAWTRNPGAVLDEPATDNDSDTTDPLVVLLACLIVLAGLLLTAQIANPEEVIPQIRFWMALSDVPTSRVPEIGGLLNWLTVIGLWMTIQLRR